MAGFDQFKSYEKFQSLTYGELKLAVNYICSNLNCPSYNYRYWYDMYCYTSKSFIVMQWRKERGFKEYARLGETVCNGVIVNFLKEREHLNVVVHPYIMMLFFKIYIIYRSLFYQRVMPIYFI